MHRTGRLRRTAPALAALALVASGLTACSGAGGPGETVGAFLDGWRGGDLSKVGFVTAAGTRISAEDVQAKIKEASGDLAKSTVALSAPQDPKESGDDATATIKLDWTLPGGVKWAYDSTVRLTKRDTDGWRVVWEPAVVHNQLTDGEKLELRRTVADRADIIGPDGKPIVTSRPIVAVGISPELVTDQKKLLEDVGKALKTVGVELDREDLETRLRNSDPGAFVDVVTLRRADYDKIRSKIRDLDGTVFRDENRELAPTRYFGRSVLGTVDPATREDIDARPTELAIGDQAGHGGLQQRYDVQLRGTPGQSVVIARPAGDNKTQDTALFEAKPVAGKPIKTTLDTRTQAAADAAVGKQKQPSSLIAVRISDSTLLAVSNGPDGNAVDAALTGQVPPGSTFKMVSTLGLLDKGVVTLDGKVDCPRTKKAGDREFKNSHDMALGQVPFRTDFAKSCNTAFVNVAPKLGADGLQAAATALGIGAKWDLGVDAFSGTVSPADSPTELAAASVGQGATVVSPVAMAAATAAVARGKFQQPKLLLDPAPAAPAADGPELKATSVEPLRTMMREVVTKGTATALAKVPGGAVHAKTGTAEFETGSKETHSWVVGWQGDVAFAVMVQKGGSSSEAAVPLAAEFLTALAK